MCMDFISMNYCVSATTKHTAAENEAPRPNNHQCTLRCIGTPVSGESPSIFKMAKYIYTLFQHLRLFYIALHVLQLESFQPCMLNDGEEFMSRSSVLSFDSLSLI